MKLDISDYIFVKRQIESEFVDGSKSKPFLDLPKVDQQLKLKERLKTYCQKVYWKLQVVCDMVVFVITSGAFFSHLLINGSILVLFIAKKETD